MIHLVWEVVEKVGVVRMEGEVAVVEVADLRKNCSGLVVRALLSAPSRV